MYKKSLKKIAEISKKSIIRNAIVQKLWVMEKF
jgi:hypothetical protein